MKRSMRWSSKCKSVVVIGRPITKIQPFMVWNYEHQSIFREKTTKWWPTDNKNPYLTAIITSKRNSTVEFEAKDQLRWWPWSPRRHQPKPKQAKGSAEGIEFCSTTWLWNVQFVTEQKKHVPFATKTTTFLVMVCWCHDVKKKQKTTGSQGSHRNMMNIRLRW